MIQEIIPKLPMINIEKTKAFYINQLGFEEIADYGNYLILSKNQLEIHFFEHNTLVVTKNYGQIYIRTNDIETLYQSLLDNKTPIHPQGALAIKPWKQKEFALLDPDFNLITFGQSL